MRRDRTSSGQAIALRLTYRKRGGDRLSFVTIRSPWCHPRDRTPFNLQKQRGDRVVLGKGDRSFFLVGNSQYAMVISNSSDSFLTVL